MNEVSLAVLERALSERSFLDFLSFVRIIEPPPGRGVIRWEPWAHLVDLGGVLSEERWDEKSGRNLAKHPLIVIGKARQLGVTWELAAYSIWKAEFYPGSVIFLFSQGETESSAFLGKCKFIQEHLPGHLQSRILKSSSEHLVFANGSTIYAMPSTEKAGRSETATLIVMDEADNHEYLEACYLAAKPTIDGGGQLVMISTINKQKPNSLFRGMMLGAPENNFTLRVYGVFARPGRDEEWWQERYKEVQTGGVELKGLSPELYMEQEYPRDMVEMLAPSRTISAFDFDVLKEMQADTRKPVEVKGFWNIYQKPAVGKRNAAGTDSSHGVGKDSAVTAIMDVATGVVVADIFSSLLSPEALADESVKLLAEYGNPIWAIEDNEWGILVIRKAQELEYPKLYERKSGYVGWHTNEKSRFLLWGELIEAVRERLVVILSEKGLQEFFSVIKNADKNGRIEAMTGRHDDYPLAVGLAWQMRKEAYLKSSITPVHIFYPEERGNLPPTENPVLVRRR